MSIEALEKWVHGHKGRYVRELEIGTGYGATCWSLVLGNINIHPKNGWAGQEDKAEVFAAEVSFYEFPGGIPPNVVFVVDGNAMEDWPGLAKVIEIAIECANTLKF